MSVLPDVLAPGLRLVICGSAAGTASARAGAYYAHPHNRFWRTLHEVGLTPRRLAPHEFREVVRWGIGLTDMAKHESGPDAALSPVAYDAGALRAKLARVRPAALAFNGKAPAAAFLGAPRPGYGRQASDAGPAVFVLPSTSPAARAFWDVGYWREVAEFVRAAGAPAR